MLLGILPPYRSNVASDPVWMRGFAQHAEEVGFESIYTVEHVVVPADYEERYPYSESGRMPLANDCELPDPLDLLGFIAASTERIHLATGILVAPHHHPLILGKRVATIDRLSGGRMRLGVGVGWMREELEATGVAFETRGRRLDEQLQALREIWTSASPSFHGDFYEFTHASSFPKPAPRPGGGTVPIHIGGHSVAAARRAGRFGDGFQPLGLDHELLVKRLATMRSAAEESGRNHTAIELTLGAPLQTVDSAAVAAAAEAGAQRLLLSTATADLGELSTLMAAAVRVGGVTPVV